MKNRLALCISALMLGTSAYAAPGTGLLLSGNVSAGVGMRDCVNTDDNDCGNHTATNIAGRVSVPLGSSFSIQADAEHERYSGLNDKINQVQKASVYGLHASYRDPNNFLIGAFGGYTYGQLDGGWDKAKGYFGGVEGQYYFDRATIYAQFGNANIDNYNAGDNAFDGRFWGVALRYFPSDDTMLEVAYARGKSPSNFEDKGDWGTANDFSVQGKMRLTKTMPLYGFAQYKRSEYIANTEDNGSENTIMVGASWEFGAPSLYANDRRGATLTTPMLPGRAVSWAQALD